ncbi:MAG: hypothetical protein Q4E13_14350, partial [Clostridia bacterium]|nr:hypothetical protein [Clostridia bacterium]
MIGFSFFVLFKPVSGKEPNEILTYLNKIRKIRSEMAESTGFVEEIGKMDEHFARIDHNNIRLKVESQYEF